ncbi:hypothetical protein C8Q73DRAFT_749200 [Cubamyces lactineus]|nr:hypothetical protein C8Q73DRAFT_749200 [Cubamyces lactineus]
MSLAWHRGCVALVGPRIDAVARAAIARFPHTTFAQQHASPLLLLLRDPASSFHLTLFTKDELRDATVRAALLPPPDHVQPGSQFGSVDTRHLHFVGIGGSLDPHAGVFFAVVVWATGQILRVRVGLDVKQFHIMLLVRDDHTLDKGFDAVLPMNRMPGFDPDGADFLDHPAHMLHMEGRYSRARCAGCYTHVSDSVHGAFRGFLRFGVPALRDSEGLHKLAMLAYACAYARCSSSGPQSKVRDYCLKRIEECAQHTEWGCVFMEAEQAQLPAELVHVLLEPWPAALRDELSRRTRPPPTLCIPPREPLVRQPKFVRLPRFFCWLVPFHIALMSTLRTAADIDALASPHLGIRHVLTLTKETPLDPAWFSPYDPTRTIRNTSLPIPNYMPPSIEQMDLIMRLLFPDDGHDATRDAPAPVLIHCGGGKGRAGTVAACYLVACGFTRPSSAQVRSVSEPAMSAHDSIAAGRALRPGRIETQAQEEFVRCKLVPEPPPCPLEIQVEVEDTDAGTVLRAPRSSCCSSASSGLAGRRSAACSWHATPAGGCTISQDEGRSRSACETALGHARRGARVLVDLWSCATSRPRGARGSLGGESPLCESRTQNRAGHPTLPPGSRMEGMFGEGFKAVVAVRSFEAAEEPVVGRLSPPVGLFKFPRTPHLLDLGSATDDDIVLSSRSSGSMVRATNDSRVVLTEQVDGGNLGLSLSSDCTQILVQNRSHYRYVLFGEWLVATHSIAYDRLPHWFLAFDLYDRSTGRWADRCTLQALLAGTNIRLVPVVSVHQGRMASEDELRDAVMGRSRFYDGPVEGVYVKVERGGEVVERGKVVRADFNSRNEHWSKGPLRKNKLQDSTFPAS